ncbi:hypothetical protein MTR_6g038440 [Medicago truncatula]|uniref:Uncharacterized protein n=1 Tax=Medicago truncatula TaxID=3880 RepID=A0A072U9A0_MEDTR|nr:hypothetical protein MTR_6g038440 [Medicago truncatula]
MPTHISSTIPATTSTVAATAQSQVGFRSQSYPNTWLFDRNQPYGMSSSFTKDLHTNSSSFSKSLNAIYFPLFHPRVGFPGSNPQQSLTNASLMALRQQMEFTNHEMVNILTQQIVHVAQIQQHVVEPQQQEEHERVPILVQRNQDTDQIVRQVHQNNFDGRNKIANIIETFLVQNGFNIGLHRPNFVSSLSDYVLAEELTKGWKIPKFTKFGGETNKSTVEHISRYLTEPGDIANNENLR